MEKTKIVVSNWLLVVDKWVKRNRTEAFFLAAILLFGAFLRLYRIDEYMTFLGDEGRDAILVRRLLVDYDPILIGPGTSIGNMYLGPLYYYFVAPALLFANFSPAGPSVMIALLGVATVFLVWFITREWFGRFGALIAAFLYALAPVVIVYSRSSWNPNIMPFFALLCVYATWRVWTKKEYRWLIVLGISYAFVMQSHYLGLLLAPTFGLFGLLSFIAVRNSKTERKLLTRNAVRGLVIFAALMSPLLIFDYRHGWINANAMKKFFTERQTTVSARPWNALPNIRPIIEEFITRTFTAYKEDVGRFFTYLLGSIYLVGMAKYALTNFRKLKDLPTSRQAFFLLFVWVFVAIVGLSLYKQEIYDHYYGIIFAAPFILFGGIVQEIVKLNKRNILGIPMPNKGYLLVVILLAFLLPNYISASPLKYPPNRQLQRTMEAAEKIRDEAGGKKFNLAVIAERNYEDAYQYFLEKWGTGVTDIDPLRAEETVADQLFVVCELPKEKCDPTHSPKAEIANFGWSGVEVEWGVAGVTIYKLVHTQ